LSGNPLAALTTFELLFRPMLCAFLHTDAYEGKRKKAIIMGNYSKESTQRRFVGGYYEDGQVWFSTCSRSSVLSSMLGNNCLIDIKAGTPALRQGHTAEVVML
ncbi:MAG: molybdopterin molybdenumtransferase MoeA, partial [Defluviitaleaceae bacterium]|nr:molybdopterin molybdenumtransferase MoeA [Defluviitaleaceae bacterium]